MEKSILIRCGFGLNMKFKIDTRNFFLSIVVIIWSTSDNPSGLQSRENERSRRQTVDIILRWMKFCLSSTRDFSRYLRIINHRMFTFRNGLIRGVKRTIFYPIRWYAKFEWENWTFEFVSVKMMATCYNTVFEWTEYSVDYTDTVLSIWLLHTQLQEDTVILK